MSYVFSDAQTKLSSLLGDSNTSADDQWPLAVRKKELNRGELRFARDTKILREYATGSIASKQLALPSDFLDLFVLYLYTNSTYYKLTKKREISAKDLERFGSYSGDIPFYYIWEFSGTRYMKFVGSSNVNTTYQLFYIKKPVTELSADADVSLFPEEYREGPVYIAAAELMLQVGNTEMAMMYEKKYLEWVAAAQKHIVDRDLDYDFPNPDMDNADFPIVDVQGGGYPAW